MKVIFFDLDDTLYASSNVYQQGLKNAWECFQEYSSKNKISFAEFETAYKEARAQVKERLGINPMARSRLLYFKQLIENLHQNTNPQLSLDLDKSYHQAYKGIAQESVVKLLQDLRKKYQLAIITNLNCSTQLQKICEFDPEAKLFSHIITSEEVGAEKPAPVIFLEAIARFQVELEDCCMVGDNFECDILGASALGIRSIYLNPEKREFSPHEKIESIQNLEQVRDILLGPVLKFQS